MTTFSYIIPYPKQNRFSVWFTGGCVEVKGGADKWHTVFSGDASRPARSFGERAQLFAAGLLMGATTTDEMNADGVLSFELTRPIAANIDLIYMDEMLRIMRTSKGTTYVFARAHPEDYSSSSEESYSSTPSTCTWSSGSDTMPELPARQSSLHTLKPTGGMTRSTSGSGAAKHTESRTLRGRTRAPLRPVRSLSPNPPSTLARACAPSRPTRRPSPAARIYSSAPRCPWRCLSPCPGKAPSKPMRRTSPPKHLNTGPPLSINTSSVVTREPPRKTPLSDGEIGGASRRRIHENPNSRFCPTMPVRKNSDYDTHPTVSDQAGEKTHSLRIFQTTQ